MTRRARGRKKREAFNAHPKPASKRSSLAPARRLLDTSLSLSLSLAGDGFDTRLTLGHPVTRERERERERESVFKRKRDEREREAPSTASSLFAMASSSASPSLPLPPSLATETTKQHRPSSHYNSPYWTTNSGAPVWNNNNSSTVGVRGTSFFVSKPCRATPAQRLVFVLLPRLLAPGLQKTSVRSKEREREAASSPSVERRECREQFRARGRAGKDEAFKTKRRRRAACDKGKLSWIFRSPPRFYLLPSQPRPPLLPPPKTNKQTGPILLEDYHLVEKLANVSPSGVVSGVFEAPLASSLSSSSGPPLSRPSTRSLRPPRPSEPPPPKKKSTVRPRAHPGARRSRPRRLGQGLLRDDA